jgi:predicted metal-dependent phosphoesterase TrpH
VSEIIESNSGRRWLKAELHSHCSLDPIDYRICGYSPEQLISAAAKLGYEIFSITCHNKDIWTESLSDFAANLGITLIPGIEVSAEGTRHILAYNFRTGPENLNTLERIRERRREDTLVVAPHAYFPGRTCLRELLDNNLDIFDAIEYSGFKIRGLDFNRKSTDLARKTGKPLLGCGDIHYLWQLGRTSTWIYSEPCVESILSAIKQGLVRIQAFPLTWLEAAQWWAINFWRYAFPVNPAPSRHAWNRLFPARR